MSFFTEEYQQKILQSWHTFVSFGTLDASSNSCVRSIIHDSWVRSFNYKVDPFDIKSSILSSDDLKLLKNNNSDLISVAHSYMENLYSFVKGSNYAVILTDKNGIIIDIIGDEDIIQTGKLKSKLVLGSHRSEQYAGTNAIGTCLAQNAPLQVYGAEHFAQSHQSYICSSAPIHNEEGTIIGCLDITGPREEAHLHTLGMVVAAVDGIEKERQVRNTSRKVFTANQQLTSTIQSIPSGVVMIDNSGSIIQSNKLAASIFNLADEMLTGKKLSDIIDFSSLPNDFANFSKAIISKEVTVTNFKGKICSLSLSVTPIYDDIGYQTGAVIVAEELKNVHKLVNKISGFTAKYTFDSIIGSSNEIKIVKDLGMIAANSISNVLILGESGTGKELIAQSIHNASKRSKGPFIAINCGAMPKELIESELFGYEYGAFTGAIKEGRPGKFELADGGTIFLDEIGDMPLDLQVSLLRVLQTREVIRLGGSKSKAVDVKIISATNSNLEESILNNTFRSDLFYRLNVFSIYIPPLRDRKDDIYDLSNYFLSFYSNAMQKHANKISDKAKDILMSYSWPGNVRELENTIERAINLAQGQIITPSELPRNILNNISEFSHGQKNKNIYDRNITPIKDVEYKLIIDTLIKTAGNMKKAAELLGIGRRTLYRKLNQYNIDITNFR